MISSEKMRGYRLSVISPHFMYAEPRRGDRHAIKYDTLSEYGFAHGPRCEQWKYIPPARLWVSLQRLCVVGGSDNDIVIISAQVVELLGSNFPVCDNRSNIGRAEKIMQRIFPQF